LASNRTLLLGSLALAAVLCFGAGSSPDPVPPRATTDFIEGNVVDPPFARWGPSTDEVFRVESGSSSYSAEIHYDLGLYFFEQGEYEMSLTHYRRAADIDPQFAEAYFGIGLLFYTLGDDENAIRNYEHSLKCNPADADTQNNLGLIYYRKGELTLARSHIEEAIRLQPRFPDAFYNLGLVYYLREAINLDPFYVRARFNLGVVYFELGMNELAEAEWGKVIESAPGTALAEQAEQNLVILKDTAR
jgi:tetratricopeptide (TPR) repeat protein